MSDNNEVMSADVVLVGAGIMSTTLAVFLKELQPRLRIAMIERMPGEAMAPLRIRYDQNWRDMSNSTLTSSAFEISTLPSLRIGV